ncbi:hypothetical protein Rhsp01_01260 [Rhizobium sp. NBRC 114257]|uniref:Transmembrane protein n=2 Tax=Rhizobium TaxID=379 RepID=A0ABQ0YZ95_9HYPH|nr:hypothetical protein RsS93_11950 [Rhizobium dioscoreae]GLU78950.1 hypothetical protein Rhsp01_01260 [Rhizobium sp. NBRC 114257]
MDQINPTDVFIATGRVRTVASHCLEIACGAIGWGSVMAVSALAALYVRNGLLTSHLGALTLVYFFGGALSWPVLVPLTQRFARQRPTSARFAAFFLALSIGTAAMTALLFAMDYRWFYSRWHAPFGSLIWIFQFLFTGASAVYQFAVLGLTLFLPFGLLCLTAVSAYLARRAR